MARLTESPFTVLVDTREQLPYTFAGLKADAVDGGGPLTIPTTRCTLKAGDYSIDGYANMVCVERKTASDLAGTLTRGRRRFMAEMDRLREYDAAWIVIEAELSALLTGLPLAPQIKPRTLVRSAMFWQVRFPKVHWWACPGRGVAEAVTYQLLRTWWRERIEAPARETRKREKEAWEGSLRHQLGGGGAGPTLTAARRRGGGT